MTLTKNQAKTASSLILAIILFSVTLTYATAEDNYQNDTNPLPTIFEATLSEGIYKTNVIINPSVTGVYSSENNYKLNLAINTNGVGHALTENNYKINLIPQKSFPDQHDLKVTNIVPSRAIVGKGYNVSITVTVANQELDYETFHLTINASTATINTQIITLTSRAITAVTLKWNTTDFAYGYYTINAQAHPVPGEAFTWDNTLLNGVVMVTIPGDVNGDKFVTSSDLSLLLGAYGKHSGQDGYTAEIDITGDGYITSTDLSILLENYGKHW